MKGRNGMSCRRFADWLDSGMPVEEAEEALAHAAACPECAARQAAAGELEILLGGAAVEAPPTFTAAVMERVGASRPQPAPLASNPLPLWVRAIADPAAALTLAASAGFVWALGRLPERERLLASWREAVGAMLGANAPGLLDGSIWSPIVVSLAPTLVLVSLELYRWSVGRVHAATPPGAGWTAAR